MPKFAHLIAEVPCPGCGANLVTDGRIAFQWGFCENTMHCGGEDYSAYRIGDPIHWRTDVTGRPPAWTYFSDHTGNIGDPTVRALLIREWEMSLTQCPACHIPFDGIAVEIRDGVIRGARAFTYGLPDAEVSLILPDGSLAPRPEWDDHPMQSVS